MMTSPVNEIYRMIEGQKMDRMAAIREHLARYEYRLAITITDHRITHERVELCLSVERPCNDLLTSEVLRTVFGLIPFIQVGNVYRVHWKKFMSANGQTDEEYLRWWTGTFIFRPYRYSYEYPIDFSQGPIEFVDGVLKFAR